MGISGLLPALESITERKHIRDYHGKVVAVDGYCWLHRAVYSCCVDICLGKSTTRYVNSFMSRVQLLLDAHVVPYIVFDGAYLPSKQKTEIERERSREENMKKGLEMHKSGRSQEAHKYFSRAVDVTAKMAHDVIQQLKAMNVQYVVAPYEADAQMAYLSREGLVDVVISEDSDCIPYGCSTMDREGYGDEITQSRLRQNTKMILSSFTDDMILNMCIFSGCDYLPSLPGYGLVKSHALIKKRGGTHTRLIRNIRFEGKTKVPTHYEQEFERARRTFHYQRVYDPRGKKCVHLTTLPSDADTWESLDFLGAHVEDAIIVGIAQGDLDPNTKEPFVSPIVVQAFIPFKGTATEQFLHGISVPPATFCHPIKERSIDRFFRKTIHRNEIVVKRKAHSKCSGLRNKIQKAMSASNGTVKKKSGVTSRFFAPRVKTNVAKTQDVKENVVVGNENSIN